MRSKFYYRKSDTIFECLRFYRRLFMVFYLAGYLKIVDRDGKVPFQDGH